MLLRKILKQQIDTLSDRQLRKIAEMNTSLKPRSQETKQNIAFWQNVTPLKRANNFRKWANQLPITKLSLSDCAGAIAIGFTNNN